MAGKKHILVVGAGVTGLASAVMLAERGLAVTGFERAPRAGGLLAPVPFASLHCDRGSHRVHPAAAAALVELTADADWQRRPRVGALLLAGRIIPYPPTLPGLLRGLGLSGAARMGIGFAVRPGRWSRLQKWERHRAVPPDDDDEGYEAFVLARVGRAAYTSFYRPYAEKVWGVDPATLSRSVAKQRFSTRRPVGLMVDAVLRRAAVGRHFLYPRRSMAAVVRSLVRRARALGVHLQFERPFDGGADRGLADEVVYTGPLTSLVRAPELEHRGLHLLHVLTDGWVQSDVDTFYAPELHYWFGRVSRLDRFSPSLAHPRGAVLCVEIPAARRPAGFDPSGDALAEVHAQLIDAGILRRGSAIIEAKHTYVPQVYPLYRRGWVAAWRAAVQAATDEAQVMPAGRQGLYLHCNLDHCVAMAGHVAEVIGHGGGPVRWREEVDRYLDVRVHD